MPTIAAFHGIIIYMYWAEHGIAHLHALKGDHEATFNIDTGKLMEGELPRRAKKMVQDWIALRREALMENWRRGRNGLPFQRIPGPDNV
jgi:Domain of unknown function (DUF4160)